MIFQRRLPAQHWDIVCQIAERHEVNVDQLLGPGQNCYEVAARREAAHYLRRCGYSYPRIGRWLGGRHHTTIMHLCKHAGWIPMDYEALSATAEGRMTSASAAGRPAVGD